MESWEAGPTAYAGPASPVRADRAELGALATAGPSSLWLDVVDATIRTCAAHGRADLVDWLWLRRAQLLHPHLRVLVAGASGQGKSHLINALVNAPVCAVGDDAGTTVPAVVRHAATPTAHLVRRTSATADWTAEAGPHDRVPLALDRLRAAVTAAAARQPAATADHLHADIGIPRSLLAEGLVLIDTPGLPGLPDTGTDAIGRIRALATYTRADLVLFTCDAGRELGDAELEVLADLSRLFPSVLVAFTRTDTAPHWRRDLASNRMRLIQAGVPATVLAVSSVLRTAAARTGDAGLNTESGFPALVSQLRALVAAKPDRLARATVGVLGRIATERLAAPLRDELEVQRDGGSSDAVARLHETQRRMDELRKCATRWQNRLSDEVGDLMSDIEHDLRERTRAVLARSDEFFTGADPLRVWDDFEPWLREALQDAAQTSLGWLGARAGWLAHAVAGEFPVHAGNVLPPWAPEVPDDLPDRVTGLDTPAVERFTASQKLFTGLRGSYGGVLMFGLATGLAGMSLINPISIGGGALFGGKSIREEGRALLKRRQATARGTVQRHVDETFVALNKDAKDAVRRVQRALRDHFTSVTEDLQEAIVESLRAAKAAADQDTAARQARVRRLEQELIRLAELQTQARSLSRLPT